ncbi:hypothetical protein D3C87_1658000 [compost metagenome]
MVHARAWLALRLRRIDGQLQEAAPAHHIGELAELGRGFCRLGLKLRGGQTRFQRGPRRKFVANGVEIVGDAVEEGRTAGERGMAVKVKGLVGECCSLVNLGHATQGEIRLDQLVGGGIERLHRPLGGRDIVGADNQGSCQFHRITPAVPGRR